MIHFTGLNETMTRQECLDWSETDFCAGMDNYVIVHDTADSIAGTHTAWGTSEDGDCESNCFSFARKSGYKMTGLYGHARPLED